MRARPHTLTYRGRRDVARKANYGPRALTPSSFYFGEGASRERLILPLPEIGGVELAYISWELKLMKRPRERERGSDCYRLWLIECRCARARAGGNGNLSSSRKFAAY